MSFFSWNHKDDPNRANHAHTALGAKRMTVHAYAWRWIAKRGIARADVTAEHYAQIRAEWEAHEHRVFRWFVCIVAALTMTALLLLPSFWPLALIALIGVLRSYWELAERIYL